MIIASAGYGLPVVQKNSDAANLGAMSVKEKINFINQEIAEKGLNWTAGETSVLKLPPDQQMKFGFIRPSYYFEPARPAKSGIMTITGAPSLSSSLDWRNKDGQNWITPVKNQLSCGSCWAFGIVGVLESKINIDLNKSSYGADLAEQHLLSCSGAGNCITGGEQAPALAYAASTGLVKESCFPYTASDSSCSGICSGWQNHTLKANYSQIQADLTAIKTAIDQYGPVTVYMAPDNDFFSYAGGVYSHATVTSGWPTGYHLIDIIGYNDTGAYWICKNSWGTSWGESGFFKIAYSESVLNYTAWLNDPTDIGTFFLDDSYHVISTDIGLLPTLSSPQANVSIAKGGDSIEFTAYAKPNSIKQLSSVRLNGTIMEGSLSDGGTFSLSAPLSFFGCSGFEGPCPLYVNATDDADKSVLVAMPSITVDDIAPLVQISAPLANGTYNTATVVNVTATDTHLAYITIYVNGAPIQECSSSPCTYALSDGIYLFYATANDTAGNTNTTGTVNVAIDTTAPAIFLNLPLNNFDTAGANVTFNWTATDTLSLPILCNLTIDGAANKLDLLVENGTWYNTTATTSDFADGLHTWSVSCRDSLGNTNDTIPARDFTVDTTAPSITPILPAPGANLSTTNVTFNFTATDATPDMSCNLSINGAINKTVSAITNGSNAVYATNDFLDGNYNWSVSCRDTAGNVNDSMVARDFTVDTTPPAISLNLPLNNFDTAGANVTFNWTATDTLSMPILCNLTIDGAVNKLDLLVENGIFITTSEFADGAHTWSVSCRDNLGNTNSTIPARDFTVDTIPPSISYVKITPKSAKPNSNVTLIAAIDDSSNVNTAYLVVYNSSWTEAIPQQNMSKYGNDWFLTFNISSSPAGIYYFNITATDADNKATVWVGNLSVDGTSGAANTFTNNSVSAPDNQTVINAIQDMNVSLQINTNQSISTSAVVAISSYTENPGDANTGVPALNKYLDITTSSDIDHALSWAVIKVYYDDSDIPSGYAENNLRLYYFNETSRSWDEYDGSLIGGVNTTENYVWANTTHFSIYGVFIIPTCNDGIQNQGESGTDCGGPYCSACYSPPSNPPSVSSGSSGGGSGFNYLPVLRGKLSIFGYPAYMTAEQGKQVPYTFAIKNVGNATLHDVGLAISGMNPSWFSLEPVMVGELNADKVQIFTLTVRPPANTAPKKYSLTLNATSSDDGVSAVSSMVFEVLEKAKAKPTPVADVNNSVAGVKPSGNKVQDTPVPTTTPTTPWDANPPQMDEAGLFLIGGGGLLFWRATLRRRKMHKLRDETHLMAVHNSYSESGKKQR